MHWLYIVVVIFSAPVFASENLTDEIEWDDTELIIDMNMLDIDAATEEADKKWRLILAWQNGVNIQELQDTRSHRFDTRVDWGELLFNDYFFKLDGKLIFRLPGDDNQTNQEKTQLDGRLRALYIQRSTQSWTLTAGFQTITLGEMDAVQVSDLFSPWDYSEFAFTSPEDARLGQFVINTQWYNNKSQWQFLYSPWPLTNRYPGGDSATLLKQIFGNQSVTVNDNQPKPFAQHEFLAKWQKNIRGSDLTMIYASLLNNNPSFKATNTNSATPTFDVEYSRFSMLAGSANYSAGNFLWKIETAYKQDIQFQSATNFSGNVWDLALGADYDANGSWNLSLELVNQYLYLSESQRRIVNKNNTQIVGRWSKRWLNQTLSTIIFSSYQYQYGDTVTSASASYAINDDWNAILVATIFESTDKQSPSQLTKNWDQITAKISYSL